MDTITRGGAMLTAEEKKELQNGLRVMWAIWAALFASLGIYIVVAHMFGEDIQKDMQIGMPLGTLEAILLAVSVFEFFLIKLIRKPMLKVGSSEAGSESGLASLVKIPTATRRAQMNGLSSARIATSKYTPAMVISLALAESIGVYGLMLYFMGSDFKTMLIFMAFSAVGMYMYRPKYEELEHLAVSVKTSVVGQ